MSKEKFILFFILFLITTSSVAFFLWGVSEIAHEEFWRQYMRDHPNNPLIISSDEVIESYRKKELKNKIILIGYITINLIPIIVYSMRRKK